MSTKNQFKDFYNRKLLSELKNLDSKRKLVDGSILIITLLAVILIVIIGKNKGEATIFFQVIIGVIAIIAYSVVSKGYRNSFKRRIIKKIATFIDENLEYSPNEFVSKQNFDDSNIFLKDCNDYKGEDYFKSKVETHSIEFSEIVARKAISVGRGSKRRHSYQPIFKGIFFVADYPAVSDSYTYILPDKWEKILGKFGRTFQEISTRGTLIKFNNQEFEKAFCVYSDNENNAKTLINKNLMQKLIEMKIMWKSKVYFSFKNQKVYIAIRISNNLFETRIFKTVVDYDFILENARYVLQLYDILNILQISYQKE